MAHPPTKAHQITQLLVAWGDGDKAALDELMPLVYDELRRLARHYMRRERDGHTLQTTALVNEAYLRLIDQKRANWQNRAQFFGVAAQLMRRILVDHARTKQRAKRERDAQKVSLDQAAMVASEPGPDVLAIHEALEKLETMNPRMGRIVELRYFGGLSIEETAEALKIAPGTVMKDWTLAKAFLHQAISDES
jgi:RNA polymerase sigma factor (TIGR02999 family)